MGKYQLKFTGHEDSDSFDKTVVLKTGSGMGSRVGHTPAPSRPAPLHMPVSEAAIRVLSGAATGREVTLVKVVTTIGKPGLCVASITRRAHGFDVAQVNGEHVATVNGVALDAGPVTLKMRDQIDLAGIRLEFFEQ